MKQAVLLYEIKHGASLTEADKASIREVFKQGGQRNHLRPAFLRTHYFWFRNDTGAFMGIFEEIQP